jgi:hypothetical protein
LELVNQVINEGDGKSVLLGDLVEGMVVDAHAQFPILFLDKDDRGTIWRCTWFNGSSLDESVEFCSHGIKFERGHSVDWSPGRSAVWFHFNAMVNVMRGR